jgi:hypothetical protein
MTFIRKGIAFTGTEIASVFDADRRPVPRCEWP